MSWAENFYGKNDPSPLRKTVVHSLLPVVLLTFYGYWNDFFPSEQWLKTGSYIAVALGTTLTAWIYWRMLTGRWDTSRQVKGTLSKRILMVISFPLLLVFVCWVALVHGLGGLATLVGGDAYQATAAVKPVHGNSGKACAHQLRGEVFSRGFPAYHCISKDVFATLSQNSKVDITGIRSPLGTHVSEVRGPIVRSAPAK